LPIVKTDITAYIHSFPLSLVYRVLDIVFAEGIEAIFRFSLALLQKSENKLVELEFEQILGFLQSDLFEVYRAEQSGTADELTDDPTDEEWRANEFVRDAYNVRMLVCRCAGSHPKLTLSEHHSCSTRTRAITRSSAGVRISMPSSWTNYVMPTET